jgi:hypothetical protein
MSSSEVEQAHSKFLLQLYENAANTLTNPALSHQQQQEVYQKFQRIHAAPDVTDPRNFDQFLGRRIAERYRATAPETRSDELCGCGSHLCSIRRGKRPPGLKSERGMLGGSEITPQDAREWLQSHENCHVVADALQEWQRQRQEAATVLLEIKSLVGQAGGAAPEADPANVPGVE